MNKPPTINKVSSLCQSRLFTIESLDLEFANGQQAVFERIRANVSRAAVMVAAVNTDDEILLVREWAAGSERYELQLPKGIVEADENRESAANRELAEETGHAAHELRFLQTLRTSPGYFHVGAAQVKDSRNLGPIDVATVLRRSSNVGAGKIALSLEKRDLWRLMDRLGFGGTTQVGFPGEAEGRLTDYRRWARIDQATLSFGYGISVTTLQLAQAYAALANDGELVPLSFLKRDHRPPGKRVFSARTARGVRAMLESVVEADGTAPEAAVPGYRVAGKTGTVKKFGADGYSDDRYIALFAGMAPADAPRFVIAVMIDEPRAGKFYGGQVAGPVFSAVMAETLRLLNVSPRPDLDPALRMAQAGEAR